MNTLHRVKIQLKTKDIWDVELRVREVSEIRDWVTEYVGWDQDRFEIQLSTGCIYVWFENEQDAVMCALRWS